MRGLQTDDTGDLKIRVVRDEGEKIVSGICIGDVTRQNQLMLLTSNKGDFKNFPLLGVGLVDYVNDERADSLLREIRSQLKQIGMNINKLGISPSGNLEIDADYES